jgi:penicillin-binding protein 1C
MDGMAEQHRADAARPAAPAREPKRRRFARRALFLAVGAPGAVALSAAIWIAALGPPPLPDTRDVSVAVVDRNGRMLRAYAMADGRWRLPVKAASDVDPRYVEMLLGYEDRRFRNHLGVDPLALMRAAGQFAGHGRIVSGGSTLTMQVARLIEPRGERSLLAKLRQMVRAIAVERSLDKESILDLYLTRAPFGGNLEGIRAASLAYFGKEPRRLTLGEAALLVALPQAPEARRPDRHPDAARRARDRVIERLAAAGRIDAADARRARAEPVVTSRRPMPMLAPHTADRLAAEKPAHPVIRATLDAPLQRAFETLARDRAAAIDGRVSVAIVAIDHQSGEILARVGSPDYLDDRRAGQVDMTRAIRSPGSTLKPFIYGLAFEDGAVHPETLIDDRPVRFGTYAPANFDMGYQGTVSVRRALQLSLNVPAVALLERVGASRLSARLAGAGGSLVLPRLEAPGLAMGLGGVGISLTDIVQLYGGLARLGDAVDLVEKREGDTAPSLARTRRLMDPVAAWHVGNVLIGTPPPENAAHNRVAFKTGTSYGYRDAWAVGFDGRMTIGVWVGRHDGAPVPGLTGRSAAAPILFDAFARTGKLPAALPKAPTGVLMARNARLPAPLRRFLPPGEIIRHEEALGVKIQFPVNGTRIEAIGGGQDPVVALKVAGGVLPFTVFVNGQPVARLSDRRNGFIAARGAGFARVTVLDAAGVADSVVVRID